MAPSSVIQSRIQQFESLDPSRSAKSGPDRFPSTRKQAPTYPPVSAGASSNPLEEPISPTASSFSTMKPAVPYAPRQVRQKSVSPSPPNLGCKTSLVDLKDWVVDDERGAQRPDIQKGSVLSMNGRKVNQKPNPTAPPLPPRNLSKGSDKSSFSNASQSKLTSSSNPTAYGLKPSRSDSLTVEHTYPPFSKLPTSNARQGQGHVHASSTSSFHSVSLSSDGGSTDSGTPGSVSNFVATFPMDREEFTDNDRDRDRDSVSVDDNFSFENIPSTAVSSPSLSSMQEWEKDIPYPKSEPPKLPERVRSRPSTSPPTTSPIPTPPPPKSNLFQGTSRRAPPPPPLRARPPSHRTSLASTTSNSASDRSSIFSTGTVTSAHTSLSSYAQLVRPTPVPPVARKRYETLFAANVNAQRRASEAKLSPNFGLNANGAGKSSPLSPRKGWRGLSVDLITNPDDHPSPSDKLEQEQEEDTTTDGRLNGQFVKLIWYRSKLEKGKLRDIWNDCAPPGEHFLDRDGFVKGMWRIDEELRRAQTARESIARVRPHPSKRTTISLLH